MDTDKFWISLWKIGALTLCVIVISVMTSCQMTKEKVARMVEAGADPMEASCSLSGSQHMCHSIIAAGK